MTDVMTCLWFADDAEEAARFYVSLLPGSELGAIDRSPLDYPGGKAGDVITVRFTLAGQRFMGLNGGSRADYGTAASISVTCDGQTEVDRLWDALTADGGKSVMCGWLNDRWGVPWQITPRRLTELMSDPDPVRAGRAMAAMMDMVKIDVAKLEAAVAG